jgi:hypothetical protein
MHLTRRLAGPLAGLAGAFMIGAATALVGPGMLAALLGGLLFATLLVVPPAGPYLYLLVSPLVVGVARGAIPLLRPNEILILLLAAVLAVRVLWTACTGRGRSPGLGRVDLALLSMAVLSSIVPLLKRYAMVEPISGDDILYAIVLTKYLILYRLFREAITTPSQVSICLSLAMLSAVGVALVAILQVEGWLGVPQLLSAYYDRPSFATAGSLIERGSSTIGTPFGVADLMAMNLAVVVASLHHGVGRRSVLPAAGLVLLCGLLAAGQFSGYLGLGVILLVLGGMTRRARQVLTLLLPAAPLALAAAWPVIAGRLSGFDNPAGLPESWLGRLDNLERFVLPELSSNLGWLLGVRPSARIPAPDLAALDWIYIESGYLWLLWTGGIPLLLAFVYFVRSALRELKARTSQQDPVGVAALACTASLLMITILMVFDPHLTMRGAADFFFPLLALSLVRRPVAPECTPAALPALAGAS